MKNELNKHLSLHFESLSSEAMLKNRETGLFEVFSYFNENQFDVRSFLPKLKGSSGIVAFFIQTQSLQFFFCATDCRVSGGSFTHENVAYLHDFLNVISEDMTGIPLILWLETGGVKITEKRTIYDPIWGVLPALFRLKKHRVLLTIAGLKCFGAGALFFAQGHLRISTSQKSLVNLTGPGVTQKFFGSDDDFFTYASAKHQTERHFLIHEMANSNANALNRCLHFLSFLGPVKSEFAQSQVNDWEYEYGGHLESLLGNGAEKLEPFLKSLGDSHFEILPHRSGSCRTFLIRLKGKTFGLFTNTVGHSVNMITTAGIERYSEALVLFKALMLPIVSVIDTPGGDPRKETSDSDIVRKTVKLVEAMIEYPYPKLGLLAGRSYGGSGVLSLPNSYGSKGLYALKNTRVGIMADEVIESLVIKNPKIHALWKVTQKSHEPDLSDLVHSGVLKAVISTEEMKTLLFEFLTNPAEIEKPSGHSSHQKNQR
jgi:acetyl-CoA carboxylase carboxyltransferase component